EGRRVPQPAPVQSQGPRPPPPWVGRKLLRLMRQDQNRPQPGTAVDPCDSPALVCACNLVPAAAGEHDAGGTRDLVRQLAGGVVLGSARPVAPVFASCSHAVFAELATRFQGSLKWVERPFDDAS